MTIITINNKTSCAKFKQFRLSLYYETLFFSDFDDSSSLNKLLILIIWTHITILSNRM